MTATNQWGPGEIVPKSGEYIMVDDDGGDCGEYIRNLKKGDQFPPTPGPGIHYVVHDDD